MTAFDIAWSLLKALPEQQPFSQRVRPQKQFEQAGSMVDVRRFPTVHPAIMGMMRRTQSEYSKDQGRYDRPNMEVGGPSLERGQLVGLDGTTYPSSHHNVGRIADIPTSSVVDDGDVSTILQNPPPLSAIDSYGSLAARRERGFNPEVRISSTSDPRNKNPSPAAIRNLSPTNPLDRSMLAYLRSRGY